MATFGEQDERLNQPAEGFGGADTVVFGAGDKPVNNQGAIETAAGFARGMNVGFAQGAGGAIDFLNPFDKPVFGLPGTGSAVEGIKNVFETVAPGSTQDVPEGLLGEAAIGSGQALAAFAPVVKGLQLLKPVGGAIGAFADDALKAMQTGIGLTAEVVAGGTGRVAGEAAEAAGAGPGLTMAAEIVGGAAALPALVSAPRVVAAGLTKLPGAGLVIRTARDLQRSLLPMTEGGAREVAATRLRGLAGGEERAAELAGRIDPREPLGLTPAQQTGDPNILGLERAAAAESPIVRESLMARGEAARTQAVEEVAAMGGDVGEARTFFQDRLASFKQDMGAKVDDALAKAEAVIEGVDPGVAESTISENMVGRVRDSLNVELTEERRLWGAVPKEEVLSTENARTAVADIVTSTPLAQLDDIPDVAARLLGRTADQLEGAAEVGAKQIQDEDTVAQLHGLYSELRAISRNAMSGEVKNTNMARISNNIADAILEDLGAVAGDTPVGQAINEARAFSLSLHETFDQGAVGRILRRQATTAPTIDPEAAAGRTVGRGGVEGKLAAERITTAAPEAGADIEDFLRGRFSDAATSPTGEFTPTVAARFLRANKELLADFPGLEKELRTALSSRNAASMFNVRNSARQKLIEAQSAPARFGLGQEEKAVLSIIGADDPAKTATALVNAARKDETGRALAGLKAAFTDRLIAGGDVTGAQMQDMLKNKNMRAAMSKIFTAGEMGRLNRIANSFAKLEPGEVADVGGVIDASANKLIEMVVRIAAAQKGGSLGGGSMGGSLQTANIFVSRARSILSNLTNVRARKLLMEAVEDPALFRDLLLVPKGVTLPAASRSRLAPFLTGAAAAGESDDEKQIPTLRLNLRGQGFVNGGE